MSRLARIACPNCPRDLQFRPEHAGRRVACRFCGFEFRLPRHVPISCPECRHEGLVRSEHLGRKTRCKQCGHVFRALFRRPFAEPPRPANDDAEARIERLHREIARRDQALAEAYEELNLARKQLAEIRDQREALSGKGHEDAEDTRLTNEWAVIDDEPSDEETAPGTRFEILDPDFHRDDDDPPITHVEPRSDPDMPRTEPGPNPDRDAALIATLRQECERLRGEVETLREQTDHAAIASGSLEILEKNLAIARGDAQRLSAERDEARREGEVASRIHQDLQQALDALKRDREEARRECETISRSYQETRQALDALKRDREKAQRESEAASRSSHELQLALNALKRDREEDRDEIRVLEAELADARASIETPRAELAEARASIETLQAELADARASIETLQSAQAPSSSPNVGAQPEITTDRYYEMERERDQARRELNRLRSVLDRMGADGA